MPTRFDVGDSVHTPMGKGVVREVRNRTGVVVAVKERALVFSESALSPTTEKSSPASRRPGPLSSAPAPAPSPSSESTPHVHSIDLHGLTVDEALSRVEQAFSDALLADASQLHIIHGRSGGRLRVAVHAWLSRVSNPRTFRLDPRNTGVTVVSL